MMLMLMLMVCAAVAGGFFLGKRAARPRASQALRNRQMQVDEWTRMKRRRRRA